MTSSSEFLPLPYKPLCFHGDFIFGRHACKSNENSFRADFVCREYVWYSSKNSKNRLFSLLKTFFILSFSKNDEDGHTMSALNHFFIKMKAPCTSSFFSFSLYSQKSNFLIR